MKSFFSLFLVLSSLMAVTGQPTEAPTAAPTDSPTAAPTRTPTAPPTFAPTRTPTASPTWFPTVFVENPGFPFCSVCGTDYRVGNRNAAIVLPGRGSYTCGQFEQFGFDGYVDPSQCNDLLPAFTDEFCDCTELPAGPYCNICGVLGSMTNLAGLVARDGSSTITCQFYQQLGANGNIAIEECDATSASFLAANAQCGCQPAPTGFTACPVCSPNFILGTPDATFTFEGQGLAPLSCGDYEKAAADGLIPDTVCAAATTSAIAACGGCVDVPGPFDSCNACGTQFFADPSSTAPITLDGATSSITCAEWAKTTRLGFVTPDACEVNVNITKAACGCTDEPPTPAPTAAPTETPTEQPIEPPTDSPVETPTDSPVEPPTDSPVEPPTDSPVEPPTDSPVEPPTDSPVEPPTDAPTPSPTPAPVLAATVKPTAKMGMKVMKMKKKMKKKKKKDMKLVPVV